MADKPVTVAVPEERVPEFYVWFAHFLAAPAGSAPADDWARSGAPRGGGPGGPGRRGGGPGRWHADPTPWTADDARAAEWLYRKLAPPARELLDVLLDAPGERSSGNALAERLGLEKGAHGVAGILAWPGRYCRKVGKPLPIATAKREDGGTDYWVEGAAAELFAAARAAST